MKKYKYTIEDRHFSRVEWTRRTNDPRKALYWLDKDVYGETGHMYASYYSGERERILYIDGRPATNEEVYTLEMIR